MPRPESQKHSRQSCSNYIRKTGQITGISSPTCTDLEFDDQLFYKRIVLADCKYMLHLPREFLGMRNEIGGFPVTRFIPRPHSVVPTARLKRCQRRQADGRDKVRNSKPASIKEEERRAYLSFQNVAGSVFLKRFP